MLLDRIDQLERLALSNPIQSTPDDILLDIFRMCIADDYQSLFTLAAVCTRWENLIASTASLLSKIVEVDSDLSLEHIYIDLRSSLTIPVSLRIVGSCSHQGVFDIWRSTQRIYDALGLAQTSPLPKESAFQVQRGSIRWRLFTTLPLSSLPLVEDLHLDVIDVLSLTPIFPALFQNLSTLRLSNWNMPATPVAGNWPAMTPANPRPITPGGRLQWPLLSELRITSGEGAPLAAIWLLQSLHCCRLRIFELDISHATGWGLGFLAFNGLLFASLHPSIRSLHLPRTSIPITKSSWRDVNNHFNHFSSSLLPGLHFPPGQMDSLLTYFTPLSMLERLVIHKFDLRRVREMKPFFQFLRHLPHLKSLVVHFPRPNVNQEHLPNHLVDATTTKPISCASLRQLSLLCLRAPALKMMTALLQIPNVTELLIRLSVNSTYSEQATNTRRDIDNITSQSPSLLKLDCNILPSSQGSAPNLVYLSIPLASFGNPPFIWAPKLRHLVLRDDAYTLACYSPPHQKRAAHQPGSGGFDIGVFIDFFLSLPVLETLHLPATPLEKPAVLAQLVGKLLHRGYSGGLKNLHRISSQDYPVWPSFLRDLIRLNALSISNTGRHFIDSISFPLSPHRNYVEALKLALAGKFLGDIAAIPKSGRSQWPQRPISATSVSAENYTHCYHCQAAGREAGCLGLMEDAGYAAACQRHPVELENFVAFSAFT